MQLMELGVRNHKSILSRILRQTEIIEHGLRGNNRGALIKPDELRKRSFVPLSDRFDQFFCRRHECLSRPWQAVCKIEPSGGRKRTKRIKILQNI